MLLDTSGLLSYFDQADTNNARAAELFDAASELLTHSYVLAEFLPLCNARRMNRTAYLTFATELLDSPLIELVWVDEALHRAAFALVLARQDKTYSLCDAVSFVLMRERGIQEALTTDKHFEQEGFLRLLTP